MRDKYVYLQLSKYFLYVQKWEQQHFMKLMMIFMIYMYVVLLVSFFTKITFLFHHEKGQSSWHVQTNFRDDQKSFFLGRVALRSEFTNLFPPLYIITLLRVLIGKQSKTYSCPTANFNTICTYVCLSVRYTCFNGVSFVIKEFHYKAVIV